MSEVEILFPRDIAKLVIRLLKERHTCEEIKWMSLEYLNNSGLLRETLPSANDASDKQENLVNLLPAFGLMSAVDESIWLSPNHVFERTNDKQIYKFKIRHRPPSSMLCFENSLFFEYFLLQALDDFLIGPLGKSTKSIISKAMIITLTAKALLLPTTLPLKNSVIINQRYKVKNFNLFNYHKRFSKEIYKQIITTKNSANRFVDHYYYYTGFCDTIKNYKTHNKTLKDYKIEFLKLLLENYPSYCFESYSAIDLGSGKEVDVRLFLYDESPPNDQKPGIFMNETRQCGVEDLYQVNLTKPPTDGPKQWRIELESKGPKTQDNDLLFEREETAVSFITMLQGFVKLCYRPDLSICRLFSNPSDTVRDLLDSFCPITHSEALEYLRNENLHKAEKEWCGFLIYQNGKMLHNFFVAIESESEPVCNIELLNSKSFQMFSPSRSDDGEGSETKNFENPKQLKKQLTSKYGQQLRVAKVSQSINSESIFYIENSITEYMELEEVTETRKSEPDYVLEEDIGMKEEIRNTENDDHLKRYVVHVGEDKKIMVELVQREKKYMEALYNGMSKIARLYRLHPSSILAFYGAVFSPKARSSYILEHVPYGDLVEYLTRNEESMTTLLRMKLAQQVVKIFCVLTQSGKSSTEPSLLHGNLRGNNFWVFKRHDNSFFLKLGDPGLVYFYNTINLELPNNAKRIHWLSPERRRNLGKVTVASECYAVATTIAEIFHGTDDFSSLLNESDGKIKPPAYDEAVVMSVKNVTDNLWIELHKCWESDPDKRPLPKELKDAIFDLEEEAKAIPEEKVVGQMKTMMLHMYEDNEPVRKRIKELESVSDCHKVLQHIEKHYINPALIEWTNEELGVGAFGCVHKGKLKNKGTEVAIKTILSQAKDANDKEFSKEFNLNAKLDHANIVKAFYYSYKMPNMERCMILEFMNSKTLKKYAVRTAGDVGKASLIKCMLGFALDVAKGMEYLATEGVVHCDLAARNVLLHKDPETHNMIAKVSDFGLANIMKANKDYYYIKNQKNKKLPLYWYAPEYLLFDDKGEPSTGTNFTTAGDIWAYGTTLWELFSKGMSPVVIVEREKGNFSNLVYWLYDYFLEKKCRWPKEPYVHDDIYNVMMKCWKEDEKDRSSFVKLQTMIKDILKNY